MRRVLVSLLVASLLASHFLSLGPIVVNHAEAQEQSTLNIRAFIDGRSHLILQDDTVYWHHYDFAAPGRHYDAPGGNAPTYLDGTEWCPSWPGDPPDLEPCAPVDNESRDCNCDSSSFVGVPALAAQPQTVVLEVVEARWAVAIVQPPDQSNDFTLIIEFDDNPPGGPAWYEINLVYLTAPLPSAVDIKPRSCPNPLNVKSKGKLPAAILGLDAFDIEQVDPASVRLEGVAPLRWAMEDVATPFEPLIGKQDAYDCTHDGPDGYMDLTLKFDTQEMVAALGNVVDGEVRVLQLTGNLKEEFGGKPIIGEDVVVILKKGKN